MAFLGDVDKLIVDQLTTEEENQQRRRKKRRDHVFKRYNKAIAYTLDDKPLSLDNFKQLPKPFRSAYKLKKMLEDFPDYSSKIGS